ncbi:MAG: hypothetical protein KME12_27155 [Trichocoleus desertorum ATA4-8-CV12]|jgi:hypothetical protein|nr:hypothetical protein [Trichocoleus desertorum ATA4-8-CV12]
MGDRSAIGLTPSTYQVLVQEQVDLSAVCDCCVFAGLAAVGHSMRMLVSKQAGRSNLSWASDLSDRILNASLFRLQVGASHCVVDLLID